MFAEAICKLFKIQEPIAKGIAIGSASHAIGTAKAMELGDIEGAMSSLSIVVSGILTVLGPTSLHPFCKVPGNSRSTVAPARFLCTLISVPVMLLAEAAGRQRRKNHMSEYVLQSRWRLEGRKLHYYGLRNRENLFHNEIRVSKKQAAIIATLPRTLSKLEQRLLGRLLGQQVVPRRTACESTDLLGGGSFLHKLLCQRFHHSRIGV